MTGECRSWFRKSDIVYMRLTWDSLKPFSHQLALDYGHAFFGKVYQHSSNSLVVKMMCPLKQLTEWTFILLMYVSAAGASELICPSVGYLGYPVNLTCISPSNVTKHGYTASQGDVAAICNVSGSNCTTMGNFSASIINQTHSLLTIPAVKPEHAGGWGCTITPLPKLSCNLTVAKLPVCSMTSDVHDSSIETGVSLRVNIKEYYCSELAQLEISTGDSVTEYPNETVTNITDKTVRINKTDANTELTFTCGDHSWNISCKLDNTEDSTVPGSDQTSPSSPQGQKIIRNYIVIGVVVVVVLTTTTIIRRNMKQKAPPVLQCPDPPYVEVKQASNNGYASVEDLSLQGRASMEHSCTEAYAETGFYEAVGHESVLKARQDDSCVLMETGGYSTVDARNAEDADRQEDGPPDTENYEAIENKIARESGANHQPVVYDTAGYTNSWGFQATSL